jgi:hypothetical protein
MRCESVSWSGNPASGDTSTDHLMAAKPAEPDFKALVNQIANASAKKSATAKGETAPRDDKETKLYGGPLVQVTYEPKPKKEPSAKAAGTDANAGQTDYKQG